MAKGDLSDEQWGLVAPLLPPLPRRLDGRGRPWKDNRVILNGILWVLRTGAPWHDLPSRYGACQTVHRRFQNWVRAGVIEQVLLAVARHLQAVGGLDLKECFVDGTFVPAKKGGGKSGTPNVAKAPKSWAWPTAMVFLSPYGQKVLRRLKSNWSPPRWTHDWLPTCRSN
jgi:transposase